MSMSRLSQLFKPTKSPPLGKAATLSRPHISSPTNAIIPEDLEKKLKLYQLPLSKSEEELLVRSDCFLAIVELHTYCCSSSIAKITRNKLLEASCMKRKSYEIMQRVTTKLATPP
jgi:hypothetical protein